MFVLTAAVYAWPVTVEVPGQPPQTFTAQFVVPELDEFEAAAGSGDLQRLRRMIGGAVIGWSDVVDEDGAEVPFSAEALDELIANPFALRALAEALGDSLTKGREKN